MSTSSRRLRSAYIYRAPAPFFLVCNCQSEGFGGDAVIKTLAIWFDSVRVFLLDFQRSRETKFNLLFVNTLLIFGRVNPVSDPDSLNNVSVLSLPASGLPDRVDQGLLSKFDFSIQCSTCFRCKIALVIVFLMCTNPFRPQDDL